MSARKWTKEQQQAISARGGALLVSAAAGSGKTAVLVERVIQMVCDTENPHPIDRLLVVTFTKAAATEMRERIGKALAERLEKDPSSAYLRRQQMLLPAADICTMDSFCGAVVKRYFHELSISPDFRLLDDSERAALEEEVVTNCVNDLCAKNDSAFRDLANLFLLGSSDRTLKDTILDLYRYAQAYPFPEEWLRAIPAGYSEDMPLTASPWGKTVLDYIISRVQENLRVLQNALDCMCDDAPLAAAYAPALQSDMLANRQMLELASAGRWDELMTAAQSYKAERMKSAPREYTGSAVKESVSAMRARVKKSTQSLAALFPCTEAEYKEDMRFLQPVVQLLTDTVCAFSASLFREKQAQNTYDFNDISHMTLQLVVSQKNGGTFEKTEVAKALCEKYDEIFLDEYQDTNEAQDLLFSAISRDESNLFMVGDVKQSIYSFRLAMPEIFIRRRAAYSDYDDESPSFPARITLDRNFRSRKTVANGINFIFDRLMTPQLGGVDYRATERLNPAADYDAAQDEPLELHLLENGAPTESGESPEALYVAGLVQKIIASGMQVTGKDGTRRPVRYGDICILMRSLSNAQQYRDALQTAGIPAFYQKKGGFFSMHEVRTIVSLLRALNNPQQDVPLCACLMSPIWGFTPDELAEIKMSSSQETLFQKIQTVQTEKCRLFLDDYNTLRELSTALPPAALLRTIYERTGFMAIAGAMPGGENRKLNLLLLLEYAQSYQDNGKTGLSGFLRYLDKLEENESNVEAATGVSEYADVVRIMTIHKSKGLEFPVVILAKCGKMFNTEDQRKKMLIHPEMKIGLRIYDAARRRTYDSLPYIGTKLAMDADAKAEELRVLYVAMTRAREKLILVGAGGRNRSLSGIAKQAAIAVAGEKTVPAAYVRDANGIFDWIAAALMQHPDADELRTLSEISLRKKTAADFRLQIFNAAELPETETEQANAESAAPTNDWLTYIASRVEYVYPGLPLSACPAKVSASALNESDTGFTFFATAKPAFLGKGGMTPAMRGTATHRFVEVCDFAAAKADLEQEINRLQSRGFLTPEACEMLDRDALQAFLHSTLLERMQQADALYREQKFTVFFPAREVQGDIPAEFSSSRVLVQGVIDCVFCENGQLVLVDYKTDRTKNEDTLKERYKKQLAVYKRAAEEMFEMPVKCAVLYAFDLKKEVLVNI